MIINYKIKNIHYKVKTTFLLATIFLKQKEFTDIKTFLSPNSSKTWDLT